MVNVIDTKYTRIEYERRFLVSPLADWKSRVEPYSKTFDDKYIHSTRLRLRVLVDSESGLRLIKLNKKIESTSPYFSTVSRILLSPTEYELLDRLEGERIKKVRYYHHHLGRIFSVDVFDGDLQGLVLCEIEADNLEELMMAEPPECVTHEVTEDAFFRGGNLCRTTRSELQHKLLTLDCALAQ